MLDVSPRDPEKDYLTTYLNEIKRYQARINQVPEQSKVQRIELKSKQLFFVGELAAEFARQYKMIYAARKQTYSEAYLKAEKYKKETAELAITSLREMEAEYYGYWKRWQNAVDTLKEDINAIKYRVRQDIADGNRQ
ncbi:hypothetical protein [Halobacillus salinus]|uniref:hypothetical protein n=1 Tax=Halobacillus salinus TaxID=192814 RepID=UPI0009A7253E|nr:hypothetical protein [Halobacillus salinus]